MKQHFILKNILTGIFYCLLFFLNLKSYSQDGSRLVDSLEQKLLTQEKKDTVRARTLSRLAIVLYASGKMDKSFVYAKEVQRISDSLSFNTGKISYLQFMGAHFSQHGDYSKALEYDLAALKIIEQMGIKSDAVRLMRNIGTVYHNTHNFPKALQFYENALTLAEKEGMTQDVAAIQSNIGIVYHMKNDYEKALEYYNLSLKTSEKLANKQSKSYVLNSIGKMYFDIALISKDAESYNKAIDYYNQSLSIKRDFKNKKGIANSLGNIGEVYHAQGNLEASLKYYLEGLDLALQTDYQDWLVEGYVGLSQIYEDKGDFKLAHFYYKKHIAHRDTLENTNVKEKMLKMQGIFDVEKKDKEIEILHKDNELQMEKLSQQKFVIVIGVVFLLMVVVFSIFIYRGYCQKKKANELISLQKEEVVKQKLLVDEKNLEITDSIKYAQHIQEAILPSDEVKNKLGDHFVLYKPKDIVSGDFYWIHETKEKIMWAAVDCTGHGVPGAFVSFVGHSSLLRCVKEFGFENPGEILDQLNILVNETLRQTVSESSIRDGMDIALCVYNKKTQILLFAGANNPIYIIRENEIKEWKGNSQPVGTFIEEHNKQFQTHEIKIIKGDEVVIFTDGFADQFGGPKCKKFKYGQMKDLLISNRNLTMELQKQKLDASFENWRGDNEQVDDVCMIGVRL